MHDRRENAFSARLAVEFDGEALHGSAKCRAPGKGDQKLGHTRRASNNRVPTQLALALAPKIVALIRAVKQPISKLVLAFDLTKQVYCEVEDVDLQLDRQGQAGL